MAAFDRIKSGIDALDAVLDNIRLGDNVVFQLSRLEEFAYFTEPYVHRAIADGRDLIYFRFASHAPFFGPMPGLKIYELDPNVGFETFTVQVRRIITEHGRDAFYVFDSLSDLRVAWSSDLMMANFFRVTCPYLFELDTVAFFPVLRGVHSFTAIAKIRDTTQLLLDVASDDEGNVFLHPIKVWNRYTPTMFAAHRYRPKDKTVSVLTDGVEISRYYAAMNQSPVTSEERNIDSWDRFFMDCRLDEARGQLSSDACVKMCNMMMTKDPHMRDLVKKYFKPADYFEVRDRMVGTGLVGGKSCGMLVARKIVETALPEMKSRFEPHDSFYVGTDVFYTYIVYNDLWKLRVAQSGEGFVSAAPALKEGIEQGTFPNDIREQFKRILDYYGQAPIIVRSSSFLEDGFGNAFAGKYDSVFCANVGTPDERLREFENAVRHVYASSLDRSALEYRLRNGLDEREEQMALLVMRVSGSYLNATSFMPTAAGVGYSHSAYCWMPGMDPDAGMLRLVMGLGTKAVDRTERDYPRIVGLDHPQATTAKTTAEKHRYCQRYANFIDLEKRGLGESLCTDLAPKMSVNSRNAVFEHDFEAEESLRSRGKFRPVLFASCRGLVANRELTDLMSRILHVLQDAYGSAVDIEFTINVGAENAFVVNLLQCRPIRALKGGTGVQLPTVADSQAVLHTVGEGMGNDRADQLDVVVTVDPGAYYRCPYALKPSVASLIGAANAYCSKRNLKAALFTPGRLGTSSPELGVPATFADISAFCALFEVAYSAAGYAPELSYGSHMFQDLVEADICYGAVMENDTCRAFHLELLSKCPDITRDALGDVPEELAGIVSVIDVRPYELVLWRDSLNNETLVAQK